MYLHWILPKLRRYYGETETTAPHTGIRPKSDPPSQVWQAAGIWAIIYFLLMPLAPALAYILPPLQCLCFSSILSALTNHGKKWFPK